jgi:hypothetical protein
MNFHKTELDECPIGYRAELSVETASQKSHRPKESGFTTFKFNKANPFEARNASIAMAYGLKNLLMEQTNEDGLNFHPHQIKGKQPIPFGDGDYIYNISVYCTYDSGIGDIMQMKIYYSSQWDPTDENYEHNMQELLDGLKWEHSLYEKFGYSTVGAVDIQRGDDYEDFPTIRYGAKIIDLQPVIGTL